MVENQQNKAIVITWIFPAITTVLVALRVYSRRLGRNFGWDDGLMVFAWVLVMLESIATYEMTIWMYSGYHEWDVPKQTVDEKMMGLKWSFVLQLVYHPLMGTIRASIVLFLFRLQDRRPHIYYSLHFVFWLNLAYTISTFIANINTCSPVSYVYDQPATDRIVDGKLIPGGSCFSTLRFVLASCALSIFMDLIIIPIPTAMVWNLTMPKKTKMAVVIVMSMGWIATAVSVGRFVVYYYRWQPGNKDRNYDISYTISIAESNVAMWAACTAPLKRLFRYWMPSLFGSYPSDDQSYTGHWSTNNTRSAHRRTQGSRPRNRKSDDSLFHMNDLGLETDSQEHIVWGQSDLARQSSTRAGASDSIPDLDSKPKRPPE